MSHCGQPFLIGNILVQIYLNLVLRTRVNKLDLKIMPEFVTFTSDLYFIAYY